MTNFAIRCTNLFRSYGDLTVVDDLSIEVQEGEFLALLGSSGCGKTTTLRLIAGFDRPDSGTIEIAGRVVASDGVFVPPEQRRVGMVFQEYALFPHLTVAKNVVYGIARSPDRHERVAEMLSLVGLDGLGERMPHELSGGQQQRVALARALAPRPDVILLDEPFSNLDASLRTRLRIEIRAILRRAGATAIFVTHDQEEALSLADRVAVMQSGRILQIAQPDILYRFPDTREIAEFVGEVNFVPGKANGSSVECGIGQLPLPLCRPVRGAVDVMLRPEWIKVEPDQNGDAVVLDRIFYGHDQLMTVRLQNEIELQVRLGPYEAFQPGDKVRLHVHGMVTAYPHVKQEHRRRAAF